MIKISPRPKTQKYAVMSYVPSRRLIRIHGFASHLRDEELERWSTGFLIHEVLHHVIFKLEGLQACKALDNLDALDGYGCIPEEMNENGQKRN